jgi:hypothetical protein
VSDTFKTGSHAIMKICPAETVGNTKQETECLLCPRFVDFANGKYKQL